MYRITRFTLVIATSLIFSITQIKATSFISAAFQPLLGSVDLDEPYKSEVKEALSNFKVANVNSVSIKKMDNLIPHIIDPSIVSYTFFGLWFNQDYLAQLSSSARTWNIYHEAAHYASNHSSKAILLVGILGGLSYATIPQLNTKLSTKYNLINGAIYLTTWSAAVAASFYTLQELVREQEKQADLKAARLLLTLGKEDVVLDHIDALNNQIAQGAGDQADSWHYSTYEQVEYLFTCLQALQAS